MSDYFDRVERQLVHAVEARAGRRFHPGFRFGGRRFASGLRLEYLAPASAIVIVLVVGAVFLGLRGHGSAGLPTASGLRLVFTASASDGRPATAASVDRSIGILRRRLATAVPGAQISRVADDVLVVLKHPSAAAQARALALSTPGRLAFYDWEGDALTPSGQTVASRLGQRDPAALAISQGSGSTTPGGPGAGSLSLRQASVVTTKGRLRYRVATVLLRASAASPSPRSVPAQFYVLLNRSALAGRDLVNPRQSTDASGAADVTFGFTSRGQTAFQHVTAALAHRGTVLSGLGLTLNQHFAIVLDGRLISVPSVDYKTYPDGIPGGGGADISGGFSGQSARDLATLLRFGPLSVRLTPR